MPQHHDPRSQPDVEPIQITFLTGAYAGKKLDLGVAVIELSQRQASEWADQDSDHIRVGQNFKRLLPRTFSISLTFYHIQDDIAHLVENVAHVHEITDDTTTPPLLLWQQGACRGTIVVCTSFQPKFEHPLPNNKGFHYATVTMDFKQIGGKTSPEALGAVLANSELSNYANNRTLIERQRIGRQAAAQTLLAPSLGQEGTDEIKIILDNNQQTDARAISQMSPNAFVQASVGGVFTKDTLSDSRLQDKLMQDLATVMANKEPGVGQEATALADALYRNDSLGLSPNLQQQFDSINSDYQITLKAIQDQDLNEQSPVFNRAINPTAQGRLINAASAGLNLRQIGKGTLSQPVSSTQGTIGRINQFVANPNTTDKQIQLAFGLESPEQVSAIKNSAPFTSHSQFVDDASRALGGASGYKAIATFEQMSGKM